jgi:dipeptidyl aminopeptidase/acylaminoacyl peptidase
VNEDGSGLAHLTEDVVHYDVLSVTGNWIAYVTDNEAGHDQESPSGLVLRILSLPDGIPQTVTGVEIPGVTADSPDDLQFAADQVYRAVVFEDGGPVWSPDGTQLAFVSGHDGASSDVYVYSLVTGQMTRLTDGPSHAYQLHWSPDGQYIFHTGASNFGSGAGYQMDGVWAARADGAGVRLLYELGEWTAAEEFVGWVSVDTVLVNSWRPDCGKINLRTSSIASGELEIVWPDYLNRVVYNPDTGAILIDAQDISCNPEGTSGFYLAEPGGAELAQITAEEYNSRLPEAPADPVPPTLEDYLETLLEVGSLIWVAP